MTFFEGSATDAQNTIGLAKAGQVKEAVRSASSLHAKTFSTLVLDPRNELSVKVDMLWNPTMNRFEPSSVLTLDYTGTVNNLSRWSGCLNIDHIASSPEALLKPGMTDLLRRMVAKDGI